MIQKEKIQKIIEAGAKAPSGDNMQPWRFEVKDCQIFLYNRPEADDIAYNFDHHGDYIAHGAALFNMVATAEHEGMAATVDLFPEEGVVAIISLRDEEKNDPGLQKQIESRVSYRSLMKEQSPPNDVIRTLFKIASDLGVLALQPLPEDKREIGRLLSLNEKVLLKTKSIHNSFFNRLIWNRSDEERLKQGMFVSTLGLNPIQLLIFKLLSHWNVCKSSFKIGLPEFIAKENAKVWGSGALYFGFASADSTPKSMIAIGYNLEKLWLSSLRYGLQGHIFGGLTALARGTSAKKINVLDTDAEDEVLHAYRDLKKMFSLPQESELILVLRVGYPTVPAHSSVKLLPEIIYT